MGCDAKRAGKLGQFGHPSLSTIDKLCIALVVTMTCVRTSSHLMHKGDVNCMLSLQVKSVSIKGNDLT